MLYYSYWQGSHRSTAAIGRGKQATMPAWMKDLGLDEKLNKKHHRKVSVRCLFGFGFVVWGGGRQRYDMLLQFLWGVDFLMRSICDTSVTCYVQSNRPG